MNNPFSDIEGKRMGDLNEEQTDRACELWLREQIGFFDEYYRPKLEAVFRVIDRLRDKAP